MAGVLLEKVIKFNHLYNMLTNEEEIITFHIKLIKRFGKSVLIRPFCQNLIINSNNNKLSSSDLLKRMSEINFATETLNEIISSRNHNDILISSKLCKIESLPYEIISDIASYCYQNEYVKLSQTSRSMYIGCNSPNTLSKINLEKYLTSNVTCQNTSFINGARFINVQTLGLSSNLTIFNHFTFPRKLTSINRLFLYGTKQLDQDIEFLRTIKSSLNFIENDNIYHLSFYKFGEIPYNIFESLLHTFKHIEFLYFHETDIYINRNDFLYLNDNIKNLLPYLRGFGMFCTEPGLLTNILINHYGNSINVWHNVRDDNLHIPSNIKFTDLNELYFSRIKPSLFETLIQKAQSLISITLQKNEANLWRKMEHLFIKLRKLQSLTIIEKKYDSFNLICDSIENAISKYINNNTDKNEIEIKNSCYEIIRIALFFWVPSDGCFSSSTKPTLDDVFFKLSNIVNKLKSKIFTKQFIFKIEFCGKFNGNLNEKCKIFKEQQHNSNIQLIHYAPINTDTYCYSMDLIVTSSHLIHGWSTGAINTMKF